MTNPRPDDLRQDVSDFVQYRQEYLSGDEKGEAQVFCDRLLKASTGTRFLWDRVNCGGEVEPLRGRLTFHRPHAEAGTPAPWASALVTWKGTG